ncbi:MAG: ribonuclease Z [Cytophagales bacterium]|nr:ribonuclease Z [Bernardetiaceae bacterium]MDW8205134.1 ribonuclease Z [Cytophagales bacterium]
MVFNVTILGCSSATPGWGRGLPAQVVNYNEQLYLIDCGEGTQMQIQKFHLKANRIRYILISHLHGDHYWGLPGLLSSMSLQGRTQPLDLYAPRELAEILTVQFRCTGIVLQFPLHFHALNMEQPTVIIDNEQLSVSTLPLVHGLPTVGFLFREKEKPRNLIKERLPSDLPFEHLKALKRGENVSWQGKLLTASDYTRPPKPLRSYAYCSDTRYHEPLIDHIKQVSLLYHEATFAEDMAARAYQTFHATAKQAATIALKAEVKQLVLGHFSVRYRELAPLLNEARAIFANTAAATDGATFQIA